MMDCKGIERLVLQLLDGFLDTEEEKRLKDHLEKCPRCREKEEQYRSILVLLHGEEHPEPQPYFEQRLMARIRERKKSEPLTLLKWWSLRVVPVSLALIFLFLAGTIFLLPRKREELSQTEVLLLRNMNPLNETTYILEEKDVVNKNLMLIFSVSEEKKPDRSNFQ